ncbi:hypothetical protein T440DRAFT_465191 [Plenodomus tracheiphilus IPT5]|uniref:Apple domain-containing protein n=1 Tax=Plenodomus tracheiphilus IPT5 TaxID=1408161 RepID=A0A6A7BFK1_9PLEO|nr:hypothetical protein T440DRAFT_465191 [Plenodomus tracheiphilus IPT5]
MFSKSIIILFASLLGASQAQSLGRCPVAEQQVRTQDGSVYSVCRGTDLRGETAQQVPARNPTECADACEQQGAGWCSMAVFEPQQFTCHLKSGPLDWVRSNRYTVVTRIQDGNQWEGQSKEKRQATPIYQCPTREQIVREGAVTYAICPDTDYEGRTDQLIHGVYSAKECTKKCAQLRICEKAVFESGASQCHIKTSVEPLQWTYNPRYDSIRVIGQGQDVPAQKE